MLKEYGKNRLMKGIKYSICVLGALCLLGDVVYAQTVSSGDIRQSSMPTVSGNDAVTVSDGNVGADHMALILPSELDFIIDPWELSGCGQIFSTKFMVKNVGDTSGWVCISGIRAESSEDAKAVFVKSSDEVGRDVEKNVYMEICFDDGNILILSEEEQECRVWLEPEGQFEFEFKGKINSNSAREWNGKDLSVQMIYSWETKY